MEGANIGIFLTRCVAAKVLSLVGPLVVGILLYPVALLPFLVVGDSSKEDFLMNVHLALYWLILLFLVGLVCFIPISDRKLWVNSRTGRAVNFIVALGVFFWSLPISVFTWYVETGM